MSGDAFLEACEAVRRHHGGLKPFLSNATALRAASSHVRKARIMPGKVVVGPNTDGRDLVFLASGVAVVTVRVGDEKPQSVRTVRGPVSIGAGTFALGTSRSATVLATTACTAVHMTPKEFRTVATASPTVAVGLLRWAALDLVDWLRESRSGMDMWSRLHGQKAHKERVFFSQRPGRETIEVDPGVRDAAVDGLVKMRCFQGASLHPLAQDLGEEVHLVVVPKGKPIVAHDERDGALYLLLEGSAAVRGASGRHLAEFKAGGGAQEVIIGEVAFLAQGGRDGTVTALEDCVLLQIPRSAILWMLKTHPELAVKLHHALLRTFCWRLIEADEERQRLAEAIREG